MLINDLTSEGIFYQIWQLNQLENLLQLVAGKKKFQEMKISSWYQEDETRDKYESFH